MKRKHILWIDDARTIAMLLVILGHCAYTNLMTPYGGMNYPMTSCPDDYSPIWKLLRMLTAFVFYFHVPLFMMLSGACFSLSIDKYKEFTSFVQVKAKRLLIPFFFTTLFLSVPLKYISGYYADSINVAKDIVLGQFLLMGNSHLWFVVSLFWIFLISYLSIKLGIVYRRGYIIYLVGISVVATYFYNRAGDFLGFLLALKHLVYFAIGFKYILKIDKIKWGGQILFANVVAYVFLFGIVSKLVTFSGNSVLLMGTSCLCSVVLGIYGSLIMIQFSKRLCQVGTITGKKFYRNLSHNSYDLYLFSDPFNYVLVYMMYMWMGRIATDNMGSLFAFLIRFFGTIFFAYGIIWIKNKVNRRST